MLHLNGISIRRREGVPIESASGERDIPPLLGRVLGNRNIKDETEIEYSLDRLHRPDTLKGGSIAADLLVNAIRNGSKVLILGDYDTDGATAAALGLLSLRRMGCSHVDYLVPNRFEYGYGLSPEIAAVALTRSPDLVITVDNGINSLEGVSVLKDAGVGVIITDHHLPGSALPAADAIVNPNQPGCEFPSKALSGVGVMFYLMTILRSALRQSGWFESNRIEEPNLGSYLDLVALGTVADLVPLDYNNRILVAQGLNRIRRGRCRPGILALMEVAGRNYRHTVSADLGFIVAPRLNAAGRLEDMSTGIECLCAGDGSSARRIASALDDINAERKRIEQQMQQQAMEIVSGLISSVPDRAGDDDQGLCLHQPDWHQGITGLVASRVRERTGQPVIAFADAGQGMLTGSARSVDGLHIKDLLESIAGIAPGLIQKFGGHAMAAGLTIESRRLGDFRDKFREHVSRHFGSSTPDSAIYSDGELEEDEITLENAQCLRYAAPWGQGFPPPRFDGLFQVASADIVGENHLRMKLKPENAERTFEAIAFRVLESGQECPSLDTINAVYQLDVNEFRGARKLQLIIENFAPI